MPAQEAAQGDVLKGLGPFFSETRGAAATKAATGMARTATRTAGEQEDIGLPGVTHSLQRIEEEDPMMLTQLQNLFKNIAMNETGMVDPRFAQFLRPDVTTSTSAGSGQTAATAAGLAIGVAALAVAI